MKNNIKEKYRAESIDEILEQIEVDKRKYKANENIIKKQIKRKMPLFWKKDYVYLVEYNVEEQSGHNVFGKRPKNSTDKDMILQMLNQEEKESKVVLAQPEIQKETKEVVSEESKTEDKEFEIIKEYREKLIDAEIKTDIVEKIMQATTKELMEIDYENREKVESEIHNQMNLLMGENTPLELSKIKKIVLIGPTGVGKTTTIGKIAGILVSQGKRVGFITTDVYRIGATHQLDIYAKIVNSTMEAANTPKELEEAIYYFENVEKVDHILIDTVGRSPMDAGNVEDMKSYLEIANADHVSLVLSCTQKEKDIYKIIENFEKANVNSLIFTKLDETLNHGVIVNVIAEKKANVSFITNGQDVPQDLYIANTERLSNKILRGVDDFERPSI